MADERIILHVSAEENKAFLSNLLNDHTKEQGKPPLPEEEELSLICQKSGRPVGGIYGKRVGTLFHISLLAVDPVLRGTGLGKALMMEAEKWAKAQGCNTITLTTQDYQAPDFYKACGFEIFSKLADIPFVGSYRYYLSKRIG